MKEKSIGRTQRNADNRTIDNRTIDNKNIDNRTTSNRNTNRPANGNKRVNKRVRLLSGFSLMAASLIIVFVMAVSVVNFKSDAHESDMDNKYYQSIRIEKGDSLWSIASRYMNSEYASINQYMDELRAINDLDSDMLIAGNYLSVVCYVEN